MIAVGDTFPTFSYKVRRIRGLEETRTSCEATGDCDREVWVTRTSAEITANRLIAIVGLPGAFTPTCSRSQCPEYKNRFDELAALGVDDVYILSMNDAFVMKAWMWQTGFGDSLDYIPDGGGAITRALGMNVQKGNLEFGERSWRYAMLVENGSVIYVAPEDNKRDNAEDDPYVNSKPQPMIDFLMSRP